MVQASHLGTRKEGQELEEETTQRQRWGITACIALFQPVHFLEQVAADVVAEKVWMVDITDT